MRFRELEPADFEFALQVTGKEGWGVTKRDLERILTIEPHGTFIALEGETPLGMASGFSFGELGWIGNVIVGNKRRGLGVGKSLVQQVIRYLRDKDIKHIGLYTYEENIPFYEKLRFRKVAQFARFYGNPALQGFDIKTRIMKETDLPKVAKSDRQSFGGDRKRLLNIILRENPNLCFVPENEAADGFVFAKDYGTSLEVGPMVSASEGVTAELFNSVLKYSGGRAIELGAFKDNTAAISMFEKSGLSVQREGAMMLLDERWEPENRNRVFAFGFLDKG